MFQYIGAAGACKSFLVLTILQKMRRPENYQGTLIFLPICGTLSVQTRFISQSKGAYTRWKRIVPAAQMRSFSPPQRRHGRYRFPAERADGRGARSAGRPFGKMPCPLGAALKNGVKSAARKHPRCFRAAFYLRYNAVSGRRVRAAMPERTDQRGGGPGGSRLPPGSAQTGCRRAPTGPAG